MESSTPQTRRFDLVLFGATGYTGRWALEHYLKTYQNQSINFAIAGRNEKKLKKVLEDMKELGLDPSGIPCLYADSFDQNSLEEVCRQTKVIVTTVGPYEKYGSLLVDCCVKEKTHYCDITGETHWVKQIIDKHHETCKKNNISIVPCCGFDCMPADLITYTGVQKLKKDFQEECVHSYGVVWKFKGSFSGGTAHTAVGMLDMSLSYPFNKLFGTLKCLIDGYALSAKNTFSSDFWLMCPRTHAFAHNSWLGFFPLSTGNRRIVLRSDSLLDYGPNFNYTEQVRVGRGIGGFFSALISLLGFLVVIFCMLLRPIRWYVLPYFLPKQGQGPSRKTCENGYCVFKAKVDGPKNSVKVTWSSNLDPGYAGTGLQILECGLCLAFAEKHVGGVITPAAAFADDIIKRLEKIKYLNLEVEKLE